MILYKNKQPAPTEPGWYYARGIGHDKAPIEPELVEFDLLADTLLYIGGDRSPELMQKLCVVTYDSATPLNEYHWFGAVDECREG